LNKLGGNIPIACNAAIGNKERVGGKGVDGAMRHRTITVEGVKQTFHVVLGEKRLLMGPRVWGGVLREGGGDAGVWASNARGETTSREGSG